MTDPCHILHIDMDAFFASVEQLDFPDLRGKPVLVGHDGPRGVVAAASYESRVFGCHSAMPMAAAKRACPQAIVVPVRHERYSQISHRVFDILDAFSPIVEPMSIDEAYLDLAGTERLHGSFVEVARRLKSRISSDVGLNASVGLAPNKFLAKLASDHDKPDGLTVIAPDSIDRLLLPMPVSKLWGVGKVTAAKLAARQIHTIADIRALSEEDLKRYFGSDADRYFNLARGIDHRAVTPDSQAKSIGHEQTFETNQCDRDQVLRVLADQVELVAQRLRRKQMTARGVSLKIRFGQFQTISRSATLDSPTNVTSNLWLASHSLFEAWPFEPVRLIGMSAERLSAGEGQLTPFRDSAAERQKTLDAISDRINDRFGKRAIQRGTSR